MKSIKEQFYTLMRSKGFESLRGFARACDIEVGNVHSNLSGKYKLSIERAFTFAVVLKVPIDTILAIFYPDEMKSLEDF